MIIVGIIPSVTLRVSVNPLSDMPKGHRIGLGAAETTGLRIYRMVFHKAYCPFTVHLTRTAGELTH